MENEFVPGALDGRTDVAATCSGDSASFLYAARHFTSRLSAVLFIYAKQSFKRRLMARHQQSVSGNEITAFYFRRKRR